MLAMTRLALLLLAAAPPLTTSAAPAHVRSTNARLGRAVHEGYLRSTTFRRLVATLADADVIVYVDAGECQCSRATACLTIAAASGGTRYLRASVSLQRPDFELIEQIAHELQHAIEIGSQPAVTTARALADYYRQRASGCGAVPRCFETDLARTTGAAVRQELYHPQAAAAVPPRSASADLLDVRAGRSFRR